jgi:polyisoprenoid-binding protein YceI
MAPMKKPLIAVVVLVLLGAAAYGGLIWFESSKEQDETSLDDTAAAREAAPELEGSPDGEWVVADGSKGGYRIDNEILRGATVTATGYTDDLTGSMTLEGDGTRISAAEFTIDVASITSEFGMRDQNFRRVLATDEFPQATFRLTEPIDLDGFPQEDVEVTIPGVTGELTLRGETREVTFDVSAVRGGARIDVKALIPITYTDFGIENPSNAAARIGDSGNIDVAIGFTKV